jgi:hypothetical protein
MRALLLIAALSFCGQAWSEQPQQTHKATKEKQVKADEPSQPASKVIAPSLKSQPVSEGIVPAVMEPVDAGNEQPANDKPEKNWLERFETDPVATFTGLLFFATLALWWSTRSLVKDAKDSTERQLRAYIGIEHAFITAGKYGRDVEIKIIIKNHGQTPAYSASHGVEIQFNDPKVFPSLGEKVTPIEERESSTIIGANSCIEVIKIVPMKSVDFNSLSQGILGFCIWGEINYIDIFKKPRFVRFKMISGSYIPSKGWSLQAYKDGNKAD